MNDQPKVSEQKVKFNTNQSKDETHVKPSSSQSAE